jgi:molybdenum cofactor cytidylyltransferase
MPADKMKIGAVILAAGFGRRFGSDKRLADVDGKSVLETTLASYALVFSNLRVVLRPEDEGLINRIAHLAEPVFADQAHLGMGHSLASGIAGVDWNWAFIGLADMPFVQGKTLKRLIQAALTSERLIVRPQFAPGTAQSALQPPHGHPIGFHRTLFPELEVLTGDQGARDVLKSRQNDIQEIDLDDPGITRDIDHPSDLAT